MFYGLGLHLYIELYEVCSTGRPNRGFHIVWLSIPLFFDLCLTLVWFFFAAACNHGHVPKIILTQPGAGGDVDLSLIILNLSNYLFCNLLGKMSWIQRESLWRTKLDMTI